MLISRVEEGGTMGAEQDEGDVDGHSHEYQTANELFELMAKKNNFKPSDDESLTTRDLVLIYKNIDLGTKLMSNANEFKRKTPNQYVETIVYNEDPESDSDISEIYSSEDLQNVVLINKERIDLLTNPPSPENTLCQKLGDIEIQKSDLSTEYDRKFLFKDPYIKEQLQSFNLMSGLEGTLPASLLDYICCKRLEDNYNFYMDNIIRYVKHTIEQLKRISNGDYLTEKAKEKWREVENYTKDDENKATNTKILKSSTSIPLHVERKITGRVTTWDDIIHSEIDIRSLSKILEKKIVFEVPKLICGSYRIFSQYSADNLIVSCKKEIKTLLVESKEEESRVDVVFQLTRSESGHVISNISSIMILQNACEQREKISSDVLPLSYQEADNIQTTEGEHDVMIVDYRDNNKYYEHNENKNTAASSPQLNYIDSDIESTECESSSLNAGYSSTSSRNTIFKKRSDRAEAAFNLIPPDDLRLTMQRLNMQSSLSEESIEDSMSVNAVTKKKSPTRNRIKSPYENKSFVMEEKKRKRLLEIRQRREKRKIAMTEKVSKHGYGKGNIMPQTSNSVTKLSITNKSFYNSIYGQSVVNGDHKPTKLRLRKDKKDPSPEMSSEKREVDVESIKTPVIRNQKFINRSYYLDDTITEMMYLQMKKKKNGGKEACSESTSAVSTDFNTSIKILSSLIAPSASEINVCDPSISSSEKCQGFKDILKNMEPNNRNRKSLASSQSSINLVPVDTPKGDPVYCDKDDPKRSITSIKFRKSIDKIYDLMKKIGKPDGTETKLVKSKFTAAGADTSNAIEDRCSSTVQCSDSGTSIKHHLTSSNPSCISFEKATKSDFSKATITNPKKIEMQSAMVPKVIISTKSQNQKVDGEKTKRDRKKSTESRSPKVIRENPLKAISQFLHEFDYMQKSKFKEPSGFSPKNQKKSDVPEGKNTSRQVSYRKNSRQEQNIKDNELQAEKFTRLHAIKEKKPKLIHTSESSRSPRQQINSKKQVGDITDEVRESRGEAVRGPSKKNSRLNTLAQPKRSYVQAHVEEFQSKYGRNRMSDRLQKLAAGGPLAPHLESNAGSSNFKHKYKRSGAADMPTVPVKPLPTASLEKPVRSTPLSSSSAEVSRLPLLTDMSYKQSTGTDSLNTIKNKMVAVESYVKNHYGRGSLTMEPSELLLQSRAPLLPSDLELSSLTSSPGAEECATIGSRLHHIIVDMKIPSPPPLTVLPECIETSSRQSMEEIEETPLVENVCKEELLTYSDYHDTKFKDNPIFSQKAQNVESKVFKKSTSQIDAPLAIQSYSSNEMEKLESALYRRISVGTFQKRLRIKNLTLTPKQSMQQVLLLQSGDARPVVLKSTISQEIEVSKSKSDTKDLNTRTGLSDSPLGWGFTNFPVQIATVGYAFPATKTFPCCSKSNALSLKADADSHKYKMMTLDTKCKKRIKRASEDKIKRCYGRQSESHLGQGNQTTVKDYKATSNSIQVNRPSIEKFGKEEPNDNFQTLKMNKNNLDCNMLAESINGKTKVPETVKIDRKEQTHAIKEDTSVNYSTSLDILAGLLNEIQKITTCQTQMVNSDSKYYDIGKRNRELETILNEASALESTIQNNAHQIISISSLDKLRQLESNPSIYSLYVSNDGDGIKIDITEPTEDAKDNVKSDITTLDAIVETFGTIENDKDLLIRPVCADKEVTVEFPVRELVNNFTDTPSRCNPITVNNSTTFSNSMLGVFSRPSSRSMLSFTENNALFSLNKKVIELPENYPTKTKETKECQCSVLVNEDKEEEDNLNTYEMQIENKTVNDSIRSMIIKKVTQLSFTEKTIVDKHYNASSDFDPGLKMKRDILVTVYSILVFTVFAALSFPEFMYHI